LGLGAAATPRPLAPSPVRMLLLLDHCPNRPQVLGPRVADSLGLDQAQEDSTLGHLTRLSRALVDGEAEWVSAFLSVLQPSAHSSSFLGMQEQAV
jgi:hypothetical protein